MHPLPIGRCDEACFFFSSRRRHTICYRDWSSDVCSSDLAAQAGGETANGAGCCGPTAELAEEEFEIGFDPAEKLIELRPVADVGRIARLERRAVRSEERRVGKEGTGRGGAGCTRKRKNWQ